jgi:hypothetical protein
LSKEFNSPKVTQVSKKPLTKVRGIFAFGAQAGCLPILGRKCASLNFDQRVFTNFIYKKATVTKPV